VEAVDHGGHLRTRARRTEKGLDGKEKVGERAERREDAGVGLADVGEMGELVDVGADAAELAIGGLVDRGHGRREWTGERRVPEVAADRDLVERGEEAELLVLGGGDADVDLNCAEAQRIFAGASTFRHELVRSGQRVGLGPGEPSEPGREREQSECQPFSSPGFSGLENIAGSSSQGSSWR
jgi:hypothetical protein